MPLKSIFALSLSLVTLLLLAYLYLSSAPQPLTSQLPPSPQSVQGDYAQRDWSQSDYKGLNMSLYTFSDNNRNGVYDLGDNPLASVLVRLTRPDGSQLSVRSNQNGYANFTMLYESDKGQITRAGEDYQFTVSVPPRWRATTGNEAQTIRFKHVPGSVSGLAAQEPPAVVGLMPDLLVSGRVVGAEALSPVLTAIGPGGEELAIELDADGGFSYQGNPGDWLLRVAQAGAGAVRERAFRIENAPVQLSAIDLGQAVRQQLPFAVVEDFEYLERAKIDKLPRGQSGLGWDFLLAVNSQVYSGPGYVNGLMSGEMVGYNSSGHPVTVLPGAGEERFDFTGAYFSVAWPRAQGELLLVRAFRDGELVASEELSLSYLGPLWFQADYRGIDRLELATAHYWQFVTDDMEFGVASDPAKAGFTGKRINAVAK